MLLRTLAILFSLTLPGAAFSAQPSYDCAKAQSQAEEAVCGSETLAALDRELARLYELARKDSQLTAERSRELKATQRGWIKGRDECWKADDSLEPCVATEYVLRIHELRESYAAARPKEGGGISIGPLAYSCGGLDAGLSVGFVNTAETQYSSLKWQENAIVLIQAIAASGGRYEGNLNDENVEFWIKGREAWFTLPGEDPLTCRVDSSD